MICKGITSKNKNCKQKVNNIFGYCRFHIDQYKEEKKEIKIDDIKLNEFNWNSLYSLMLKNKSSNDKLINKYHSQRQLLITNCSHIKTAKSHIQHVIEMDPIKFPDLLNIIETFNIDIEILENEKKELYMEIDKLSKSNTNITKFCNYYLSKNKSKKQSSFRIKTTDKYECAICFNEDTEGLVLNCGHKFHIQCIDKWFQNMLNCPICKKNII